MRHDQPQLIDALASEYVLGTLRGAARRRFERWAAAEWTVASRVRTWEGRLLPLALALAPLAPSPAVWAGIEERLARTEPARTRAAPRLRALAAVLVLFSILVGGYWAWLKTGPLRLTSVATIAGTQGAMLWSIQVDAHHQRLRAVALSGAAARAGHSFELWALPPGKSAPVSLGVLPDRGQREHALSAAQQAALLSASQLAVSLEPPGGSPTGAPTGPVLYVAAVKISA